MRDTILKSILKKPPKGDLFDFKKNQVALSCVFIFYKRYDLMETILHNLNSQCFPKNSFQVVIVEDRGGSIQGDALSGKFSDLNIEYYAPDHGWGKMGFMRNFGLSKARGEIILFLDDDTVIGDTKFLKTLCCKFDQDPSIDGIMPKGQASFALIKGQYFFHDPFFFTNRCMAYRKKCLEALNGFDSNFVGQEDVELAIRFIATGKKAIKAKDLIYYHPPLVYTDTAKGYAVGASFASSKYSLIIKWLLFINGIRWLPLYFSPVLKHKFMARFALGFFKGFIFKLFNKKTRVIYH
ncbi:glycosyltransferase [Desulfobacula sp.]|uniref:glycosyltransferase n=1 Tax=Desulfobacula sp. TaxID=2593537 RepID=UPI002623487A|nr:glycosyltransferase [Desulfobacula sp.]